MREIRQAQLRRERGQRGAYVATGGTLQRGGGHFGLNVPKNSRCIHIGCESVESLHSNVWTLDVLIEMSKNCDKDDNEYEHVRYFQFRVPCHSRPFLHNS